MLVSLHVKNMALIKEAEVEFGPGLNIMTGETGAGKSIVIGAVNLALGDGNFKDYMPEDADYALCELVFTADAKGARDLLEREGIPLEDDTIVLSRRYKNGRSVSRVNDETVSLSFVRELAGELIDVCSQQEHQSLLQQKNQLNILDSFAKEKTAPLLKRLKEEYRIFCQKKREWEKAGSSKEERAREMDILRYECDEIKAAALKAGEDEELEKSYRLMSNSQKIMETLNETGSLTGAGGFSGAQEEIGRAARLFSSVRGFDPDLEKMGASLEDIEGELSDFNRNLSQTMDNLTYDPMELSQIEERLDLINRLKAKYGNSIEEILASLKEREERLDQLENYETYLSGLLDAYEKSRGALDKTAQELSNVRKENAGILAEKIHEALLDLNFLDVQFEIAVQEKPEIAENGKDQVCFMISMNPGLPMRPIQSVASGGELSRIMLAIKAVMADEDEIETLIFDEIDAGISGRTAQKVSEKLSLIAKNHQILCITHLPQIASMADNHFIIEKKPADSRTVTRIGLLSEEESILELARMLGGAEITGAVMENAREMKALARNQKEKQKT